MSLHYKIYHARNKSAKDAGKVLFLSLCNRCGWHSTKVVRDTLSYHPLSHQLHTQWKSCSAASNTWTWASQADFQFLWFDVFRQITPVHHLVRRWNKMSSSILLQMTKKQLSSYFQPLETLDEAIWRVILPSSRFWSLLPTNLPLSGELPSRRGEQDLWLESGLSNSFSGKTF